jgi:hypothetical protein
VTSEEVESFRRMAAQLEALHQEISAASKKGPDKAVSAFKVKYANLILREAWEVLGASAPSVGFFEFDADELPTASDVSLIVAQFVECAEKIRCENIGRNPNNGVWYWRTNHQTTNIVTPPPNGGR